MLSAVEKKEHHTFTLEEACNLLGVPYKRHGAYKFDIIVKTEGGYNTSNTGVFLDVVVTYAEETEKTATMLKVAGSPFRCPCGANVFTRVSDNRYICNGCEGEYES